MKHKIRLKIAFSVFILLSLFCVASCTSPKAENNPPNIIVFLVDDMGVMDTSVPFLTDMSGDLVKYPLNDYYRTPNMEKLAEQGTVGLLTKAQDWAYEEEWRISEIDRKSVV